METKNRAAGMNPPFPWLGGKFYARKNILPIIDASVRSAYVEPFFGSGGLFFGKAREPCEILNDSNRLLYCFFKTLKDPAKVDELERLSEFSPMCRAMFDDLQGMLKAFGADAFAEKKKAAGLTCDDETAVAHALFYTLQFTFGGKPFETFARRRAGSNHALRWANAKRRLRDYARRMETATVECMDFQKLIESYDDPTVLFYCDPPYEVATSSCYGAPWTSSARLVETILASRAQFVVSCYWRPSFQPLLDAGFKRKDFYKSCTLCGDPEAAKRNQGTARVETVLYKINSRQKELL